ncbi:MAG TPA: sugar phosphate isomerase/epimerase family protein [Clostridia bacterium]|nr:sugar phosphate isomerase/epimerase family protein [Clostridia bacterium]
MDLGVFSRTYETGDLTETYRRMTAHGIRHTQFNLSNAGLPTLPQTMGERKIEEILALTTEYGITLDALSGTFNMIDADEEERKRGCAQFKTQCEIARSLGIPIVSICTGSKNRRSKWEWHDDNLKPSSWDDLLRSTDMILRYAEDNGIVLGVEPEASNIINTPARARAYLDTVGSPHLKIIMDGANLFSPERVADMDRVLTEAFDLLGRDIALVHAKDFSFDGSLSFVAAGQGVLDYKLYISLLKQSGYDGPVEMHGLSEAQVPESRRFLEELL